MYILLIHLLYLIVLYMSQPSREPCQTFNPPPEPLLIHALLVRFMHNSTNNTNMISNMNA